MRYWIFCLVFGMVGFKTNLPGQGDFERFCNGETQIAQIEVFSNVTFTTCNEANGSITISPVDSTANTSIQWSTGSNQNTIQNLATGTYTVTVSDANCSIEKSFIVGFEEEPTIVWNKNYGGAHSEYTFSIIQDKAGNYIVGGTTASLAHTNGAFTSQVLKLDAQGNMIWEKHFQDLGNDDYILDIEEARSGGYILTGYQGIPNTEKHQGWVAKITENSETEWVKTFGGNLDDFFIDGLELSNGHIVVSGTTASHRTTAWQEWWIMGLSPTGDSLWQYVNGNSSFNIALSLAPTSEGGFIAAGYESFDTTGYLHTDGRVTKFTADGQVIWSKIYASEKADAISDIILTPSGDYLVVGVTEMDILKTTDCVQGKIWVMKLNAHGEVLWTKKIGKALVDINIEVELLSNDDILILGSSCAVTEGMEDYYGENDLWLLKLSPDGGIVKWEKTLGGSSRERIGGMSLTEDGGFIITGESQSIDYDVTGPNLGAQDWWVAKLEASPLPEAMIATPFSDTTICGDSLAIIANLPPNTQGFWSVEPPAMINHPASNMTTIYGLENEMYQLSWTLSTDNCANYDVAQKTITIGNENILLAEDVYTLENGEDLRKDVTINDVISSEFEVEFFNLPTTEDFVFNDAGQGIFYFKPQFNCSKTIQFEYQICSTDCDLICQQALVSIEVIVEDCQTPTHISPNGDGINDHFIVPQLEETPELYPDNELVIFNRWGDVVFKAQPYQNDWEGTFNGKVLPAGTYYYRLVLKVKEGVLPGTITIVR